MCEWIPVEICKPPESHSVLLFVAFYYEDGTNLWDDKIFTGFYGKKDWNKEGFYIERIAGDSFTSSYDFLEESNRLKVLA